MFLNYIKTALRNFYRNKSITFIKILGLSLGLAVTFFILIYVSKETSYNDHYKNKNRIYRIYQNNHIHGWNTANTPFPMRNALLDDFPEIKKATRIMLIHDFIFSKQNEEFQSNTLLGVDEDFFDMFSVEKIKGDLNHIKNDNNIVVTESFAIKIFGTTDVVNKSVETKLGDHNLSLNIVAVIEDFSPISTIDGDILSNTDIGLELINKRMMWSDGKERDADIYRDDWSTNFLKTYVLFDTENSRINFDDKLKELENKAGSLDEL